MSQARPRRRTTPRGPALPTTHPLLQGLSTERERRARRRLVRELLAAGLSEDEIRSAVDEDRLSLLPAEVVLQGRRHFSDETLRRRTGFSRDEIIEFTRASGLAASPEITPRHLAIGEALRELVEAGVDMESMLEVARVAGQSLASIARVVVRVVGREYLRAGDTEYDVAARYADVALNLTPVLDALIREQLRLHIHDALRQERLSRTALESGHVDGKRDMAIAFADLVGFTRMGARVHADEVGRVAARLVELATEVVEPPVTLVKNVGDAVMLASPDVERLIEVVVTLVARVRAEGRDFPELRAGVAYGPVVPAAGDWYGHTVNLASRLTEVAKPGTVVATSGVRTMTRGHVAWSYALPRRIRGVRGTVFVARVRSVVQRP